MPALASVHAPNENHPQPQVGATRSMPSAPVASRANPQRTNTHRERSGLRAGRTAAADQAKAPTVNGSPASTGEYPCTAVKVSVTYTSIAVYAPASRPRPSTATGSPGRANNVPAGNSRNRAGNNRPAPTRPSASVASEGCSAAHVIAAIPAEAATAASASPRRTGNGSDTLDGSCFTTGSRRTAPSKDSGTRPRN